MARNEKSILFYAELMQAILDGRKTQTRRPVKWPVRLSKSTSVTKEGVQHIIDSPFVMEPEKILTILANHAPFLKGDVLRAQSTDDGEKTRYTELVDATKHVGDGLYSYGITEGESLHMPKPILCAEIKITNVRVERVHDISDDDALCEGVNIKEAETDMRWNPIQAFAHLWDSIYEKRGFGWDANPWVWVYEFEKVME